MVTTLALRENDCQNRYHLAEGSAATVMELRRQDRAVPIVTTTHPPPDGPAELGALFDLHGRRILLYLARRTDLQTAEDVLGETFVIALTRWDTRDPERGDPLPWLFGIATNLLRRHWRSEARARRALARAAEPDLVDDDPSDRVDRERAVRAVVRELDRMRPAVRDTVLLHAWAELTYEQIAAATGVPVGTVRSRLNRARAALRATPDLPTTLNGELRA
jgi:RNA polymerase sigma-70 factor (ECF subfamily)